MSTNELTAITGANENLVTLAADGVLEHAMTPGASNYLVTLTDPDFVDCMRITVRADSDYEAMELTELAIDKYPSLDIPKWLSATDAVKVFDLQAA